MSACVQAHEPQEEVDAAMAVPDKWQPLVAHGNQDQGFVPKPEYVSGDTPSNHADKFNDS